MLDQPKQEHGDAEEHEEACNEPQLHMGLRFGLLQLPYKDGQHHQENQDVHYHNGDLQEQPPMLPAPPLKAGPASQNAGNFALEAAQHLKG